MSHVHGDSHTHDHDHGHASPSDDDGPVSRFEVLETAIRELLADKGVIQSGDVHAQIDATDSRNPALGAKIVARAWHDPDFRSRLVANPKAALKELDIDTGTIAELRVLENTADVHHVVVCTLCSCYPRMILGIPPSWYKSTAYRSRVVREPRAVLEEFGVRLAGDMRIRVVDSTADLRYLVIPLRPEGTDGWSEAELARLVTRDSMIGTGLAHPAAE